MTDLNRESFLRETSRDTLNCIEAVAKDASDQLKRPWKSGPQAFAAVNTFTSANQVKNLGAINSAEREALHALLKQPIIARVQYLDENDEPGVLYITRGQPRPVEGFKIASSRTRLGRLATLEPGDEETFSIGGGEHDLLVDATARVLPKQSDGLWDAEDAEIASQEFGNLTVLSLRALLEKAPDFDDAELDAAWLDDADDATIIEGLRRAILSQMGLRDQPILDKHQDEIFRLPINSRCFLSGPPGTGKTTTLIRRLGQKTDLAALQEVPEELASIQRVEREATRPHASNWIMFSPTELLRQYVKEAFAREGQAASDDHIRTWGEYRREIARDHLQILRTSTGAGPFVERVSDDHMAPDTIDSASWYDDFENYLTASIVSDLSESLGDLRSSKDPELSRIAQDFEALVEPLRSGIEGADVLNFRNAQDTIRALVETRRDAVGRIFTRAQNKLAHDDRDFITRLQEELTRIDRELAQQEVDDEDPDLAIDEDEESELPTGRSVSRTQAAKRYRAAIQALALARARRRSVPKNSRNGILLSWLGPDRVPPEEDIIALGTLVLEQRVLQRFASIERLVLRAIPRAYKAFRRERSDAGKWYNGLPEKSADLHWQELDLLTLASLRIAGRLIEGYRNTPDLDLPDSGLLGAVRDLFRAQILVDEATDFSPVQLACMYELAHPAMRSFFLCGDMNQRLTAWGIKSAKLLSWVDRDIQTKTITVSYRQSAKLVELAKSIAAIGGASADETVLPDRVDIEGVAPVWATELGDYERIADWLFQRISEIDGMVRQATTIAVLVNSEDQVQPLAEALNKRLEEISLAAVACRDGRDVGNDRDVRVFDIRHIKGLEFEGVFFVGLDETIAKLPDLFSKYLYVGATRAATYLGVTFARDVPEAVAPLKGHFRDSWS
ncbi:ATP-binding domain-containing protein [Ovoidimarina sediminis]|uniref:ATP-binding domain-containing protein n=1 Tax=Ovoidimarina sediminis TaxID=3079856 RepID=UPI00290E9A71|nr:ATP-binding domain-containing protein [Rhodophyticola sp. MJ-SS7]MDU8945937.1 ATP-binding domain-containing protein [Rhodophyticola sp. MJ-SS7]